MNRPSWDEAKRRQEEIDEMWERTAAAAALWAIGEAVVDAYDPTEDCCLFCVQNPYPEHEEGCPTPMIEAFLDEHGEPGS